MNTPLRHAFLETDLDCRGHGLLNVGGLGTRLFDVKAYGAVGDGTTDDTAAIQAAKAAIPAAGGVLYFPAATAYKYTGATITLDRPITVLGDGGGVKYINPGPPITTTRGQPAISTIDFNSASGTLFTVAAHGCAFKDIGLRNTSGSTPTAGAGILVASGGDRTTYSNLSVDGFYINIDVQAGSGQKWDGCWLMAPVLYGLKLRNIGVPDAGDHFISNCYVCGGGGRNATSAIRIESGGGVKIVNTKINVIDTATLQNGIDLAVGDSVITVDLLVSNCSIEGFTAAGIKATSGSSAQWSCILITGNQISPWVSGNPRGIYFNGTTSNDLYDISIVGNVGLASPASTSSFIDLTNCSNVVISGNVQRGYGALATIGAGVTFARSAVVPRGGTTGQSLKKLSNADYDIAWG